MRKYLFSGAVIASLLGAIGVIKTTATGPRDWRLLLMWISWAASLAIAIGTVSDETKRAELTE